MLIAQAVDFFAREERPPRVMTLTAAMRDMEQRRPRFARRSFAMNGALCESLGTGLVAAGMDERQQPAITGITPRSRCRDDARGRLGLLVRMQGRSGDALGSARLGG